MSNKNEQLTSIIKNMGEAIIATTNTVEKLAKIINEISEKIEQRENQIQQQGYQIFALTKAVETLMDSQSKSQDKLNRLTNILQPLVTNVNSSNQLQ